MTKLKQSALRNIMKKDNKGNWRSLVLAYDQGMEHGPTDFNDKNVDPQYIIDIAKKGEYTGLIFQKGVAEKYYDKSSKVPLILKLNGKTKLSSGEPYSPPIATVEEAISLGAKAVGYTVYVGSKYESKMFKDFEKIQREAHENNLPVLTWMYPRGKAVRNETDGEILAYAARVGLELGTDFIKMKYNGNPNDLKWAVKNAGKVKILISGGPKKNDKIFLKTVKEVVNSGAIGIAVGRNIWQHKEPVKITKAIKEVVFKNKSIKGALKCLEN